MKPTCDGTFSEAEALAAGCWPVPEVATNVNRDLMGDLGLTEAEERALVAFLGTLSDDWSPEPLSRVVGSGMRWVRAGVSRSIQRIPSKRRTG